MRNRAWRFALLVGESGGEEAGHEVEGFGGFGELEVVPEGVGEGVEDDEAGVNVGAEKGAVKVGSVGEEEVARAGDEEGGRHAFEVGEDG